MIGDRIGQFWNITFSLAISGRPFISKKTLYHRFYCKFSARWKDCSQHCLALIHGRFANFY